MNNVHLYFDASALIERYAAEEGSAFVNELFRRLPPLQMTCATIGALEVFSIFIRKHNAGYLPSDPFK